MQLPNDTELATYLASTHIVLHHELLIDWDSNYFGNQYSDVSTLFEEITIDRSFKGAIPDELNVVEGYSIAQMKLTLSGRRANDSLSIYELLSPQNTTSPLYAIDKLGLLVRYRMIVPVSGAPRIIDQFTGLIRSIDFELDGSVTITVLDFMDLLNQAVSMQPVAVDSFYTLFGVKSPEAQKFNLTWALDQVLRQCGLYQSPAAVVTTSTVIGYLCATLSGSWFPETTSPGAYKSIDSIIPAPALPFVPGKYGYAANGTLNGYGQYRLIFEHGAAGASWVKGETQQMGGWVFGPQAVNSGTETYICDVTLTGDPETADRAQIQLRLNDAGQVQAVVKQFSGQSFNFFYNGPIIPGPAAWHYVAVGIEWQISNSTVKLTFNVDGVITTITGSTAMLAMNPTKTYSTIILQSKMPTQSVQWWKTLSGALTWPKDPPLFHGLSSQTDLGLALSYLSQIPDIYLEKGTNVVSAMIEAELGVLHSQENGVIKFINRKAVTTSRNTANQFILTDFDLASLSQHVRQDSFVSLLTAESSLFVLLPKNIYKSDDPDRFNTPANTTKRYFLNTSGLQRFLSLYPPFINPWTPDTINHGFHVTRASDGTIPPGVTVQLIPLTQRTTFVDIINTSSDDIRISTADNKPALHIEGHILHLYSTESTSYSNTQTSKGGQPLVLARNDWRTHDLSVNEIAQSLQTDVGQAIPIIDPVEVRCDPRLQLNDLVTIKSQRVGTIPTAVLGYKRVVRKGEHPTDTLTLRPLVAPGHWLLGHPGGSELGVTTKLS